MVPKKEGPVMYSRLSLLFSIGLLAVAFLLVPQAASANTAHSRTHVPVHVTYVAVHVKGVLGQQPGSVGTSRPNIRSSQVAVSPRLSFPGCSRQDGFNGNVYWDGYPFANPVIYVWGEVWDVCGANAQVYVSWYSPTYHNPDIGSSGYNHTSGVKYGPDYLVANPGHITVTVCASWATQWRCGTPWKVN
jgi:hypothetical protein